MVRHELLRHLWTLQERVGHGFPSLAAARKYLTGNAPALAELDEVLAEVRVELSERLPPAEPGRAPAAVEVPKEADALDQVHMRELLRSAARHEGRLPWEDSGGLTRAQVLLLLQLAREKVKRTPAVSPGPLFPTFGL